MSAPTLQQFIRRLTPPEKSQFAALAGTSVPHLYQLAGGHRRASGDFTLKLVRASERLFPTKPSRWLSLATVRPDLWGQVLARQLKRRAARDKSRVRTNASTPSA